MTHVIILAPNSGPPGRTGDTGDLTPEAELLAEEIRQKAAEAEASATQASGFANEALDARDSSEAFATDALSARVETGADKLSASLSAQHAEDAAERAESSTSMSAAFINPALTIADGLAKTNGTGTDNRFFSVPSTPDSKVLTRLYLNEGGSAVLMGEAPSNSVVTELASGNFSTVGLKLTQLAKETGYAWALLDSSGKAAILVRLDGTVELPKYGPAKYFATELSAETGYAWVVMDSVGRIAIGVKLDGSVVANIAGLKISGLELLTPTTVLWSLGDSLTGAIYNKLTSLMPDRRVVYGGAGGQTSVQIAARAGGTHALLSVADNRIPVSGPVSVVELSTPLLSQAANTGTSTLLGWLAGVYGTLTCYHGVSDPLDTYTFTRATTGPTVYCVSGSPFTPDTESLTFGVPIIFIGSNNPTNPEQIKADVEALVEQGPILNKRFLIMTPVMGGPLTPGVPTNVGKGTDVYNGIKAVEDWAAKKYGARVIKTREWTMQYSNGSPDDVSDVELGVVPRSLRTDNIHWITELSDLAATLLKDTIEGWGW